MLTLEPCIVPKGACVTRRNRFRFCGHNLHVAMVKTNKKRRHLSSLGTTKLSRCVGWERYRRAPEETTTMTTNKQQNEARDKEHDAQSSDDPWADVVCAIRDDLRAFWGLWGFIIGPRLDPGIPGTYEDASKWNGDGVNLALVFSRLRGLTNQVKTIADHYIPKTPDEQAVHAKVKSLLVDSEHEHKDLQCIFIRKMLLYAIYPGFEYPYPVD